MAKYTVCYRPHIAAEVEEIRIEAKNKEDAYDKVVYEELKELPYSAWVDGVEYKNFKYHRFNTFEGKRF